MGSMFNVRSARALAPYGPESGLLSVHAACAATAPPAHLPPPAARTSRPHRTSPPSDPRQNANFLSDANKLLTIRCAWAGTSAFASAGYGSSWAPGSCA